MFLRYHERSEGLEDSEWVLILRLELKRTLNANAA